MARFGAITDRKKACNERIRVQHLRGHPLFGIRKGEHLATRPQPLPAWWKLWHAVEQQRVDLLVIDPVAAAFVGNSHVVEFVRLFVDALFAAADQHRCGVLLVAHSTKAARRLADRDSTGSVAGSAAWTDAARGVLVLDRPRERGAGQRVLRVTKSNHSRLWERVLQKDTKSITEPGTDWSYSPLQGFEVTGETTPDREDASVNGAANPYA